MDNQFTHNIIASIHCDSVRVILPSSLKPFYPPQPPDCAPPSPPPHTQGYAEPFFPPRPYHLLNAEQVIKTAPQGKFVSRLSVDLPACMARQSTFLHSLLRPCYLERPFLEAAVDR